jgi:GNAT superfamily N-acetyltransferase
MGRVPFPGARKRKSDRSLPLTVSVRHATAHDGDLLVAFHEALYREHGTSVTTAQAAPLYAYRDLVAALREDVDALLERETSAIFIALRSGEPVGYITGVMQEDSRLVLCRRGLVEDWYVVPEARRQGVGRLLLNALVGRFRAMGCQVVESGTWWGNAVARRAHDSAGFQALEIRYGMVITDGL